jgi:hypothetical protein
MAKNNHSLGNSIPGFAVVGFGLYPTQAYRVIDQLRRNWKSHKKSKK